MSGTINWWRVAQARSQTLTSIGLGQVLIFGSYLAHRSGANRSNEDRKALYATYNCASEGDLHDDYYAHRKVVWPPMQLRRKGEEYKEGALRYGYGSPMLSVDAGKQLEVNPQHTPVLFNASWADLVSPRLV